MNKNFFIKKLKKNFLLGYSKRSGCNFFGRKTIFTQGGGLKSKLCLLDLKRVNFLNSILLTIEQNLNRTAFIGLICYENGLFSYIILSNLHINIGMNIYGFNRINMKNNPIFLANVLPGNFVHHIEQNPGRGAKLALAAGVSSFLISKFENYAFLKMNSRWLLKISKFCVCIVGSISNNTHFITNIKNAGKKRNLGFKPKVRGIAMNPCDHPHGGGEGRGSPPRAHKTPWGKLAKSPTKIKKNEKKKKNLFKIY